MTIQLPTVREHQPDVTGAVFRHFMRYWPCGVAVVTARSAGRPAGCTVNTVMSVSLDPPTLLISLSLRSRTLSAITAQHAFGVNVLAWRQCDLAERFAAGPADRFAGVEYRLEGGVPVLAGTMAAAVCRLDRAITVADHMLLLGTPQWCECDGSVDPVIFFGSAYRPL